MCVFKWRDAFLALHPPTGVSSRSTALADRIESIDNREDSTTIDIDRRAGVVKSILRDFAEARVVNIRVTDGRLVHAGRTVSPSVRRKLQDYLYCVCDCLNNNNTSAK